MSTTGPDAARPGEPDHTRPESVGRSDGDPPVGNGPRAASGAVDRRRVGRLRRRIGDAVRAAHAAGVPF